MVSWRSVRWSERGDSFDQPEARERANGIRRDAPEPDRLRHAKPLSRAPANADHCQHSSDKQQLTNLYADIEEQQRNRDRRLRQADLRERTGKAEAVQQPERESH